MTTRGGVVLLALLCLAAGWFAGSLGGDAGEGPPSYLARLTADLGLRPEQVMRIEAILADEDADLAALLDEHRLALQGPVAERRERTEAEVLAVLDDGQRMRYEELARQDG